MTLVMYHPRWDEIRIWESYAVASPTLVRMSELGWEIIGEL